MNTRQLLDQDKVWRTRDDIYLKLEEMDAGHRRATLAFLRRRAAYLARAYLILEERIMLSAPDDGIYEDWLAETSRALSDGPEAWLERRPPIRELARLVELDGRGPVMDGEVVMAEVTIGQRELGGVR